MSISLGTRYEPRDINHSVVAYIKALLNRPCTSRYQQITYIDCGRYSDLECRTMAPPKAESEVCSPASKSDGRLVSHQGVLEGIELIGDDDVVCVPSTPQKYGGFKWPPMKSLKLESYDWNVSKDDFPLMWDFTHLRHLGFENARVDKFADTLSAGLGNKLRTLKCLLVIPGRLRRRTSSQTIHRISYRTLSRSGDSGVGRRLLG